MASNRRIGDFASLNALTRLCRKLNKTLDHNKVLFFMSEQQRYNLYVYKSKVYSDKQLRFLQTVINQHQEESKQDQPSRPVSD
jgi:hypothetical protein